MAKTVLGARNSGPTIARYDITVAVTCLLRPPQPENVSAPYYVMAFHTEQQHRKKKEKLWILRSDISIQLLYGN